MHNSQSVFESQLFLDSNIFYDPNHIQETIFPSSIHSLKCYTLKFTNASISENLYHS